MGIILQKEKVRFWINVLNVFLMNLNITLMMLKKLKFQSLYMLINWVIISLIKWLNNLQEKFNRLLNRDHINHKIIFIKKEDLKHIILIIMLIVMLNMGIRLMDKKFIMKMLIKLILLMNKLLKSIKILLLKSIIKICKCTAILANFD